MKLSHKHKQRLLAIERDGGACSECGADYCIHVHHIDKNRTNQDLDNLITLCPKCHKKRHPANSIPYNNSRVFCTRLFSFTVDVEKLDELRKISKEDKVPMAAIVRSLLTDFLSSCKD